MSFSIQQTALQVPATVDQLSNGNACMLQYWIESFECMEVYKLYPQTIPKNPAYRVEVNIIVDKHYIKSNK